MSYIKTVWATGDVVTATRLNNMEEGIEDNDYAITNLPEATTTTAGLMSASDKVELADLRNDLKQVSPETYGAVGDGVTDDTTAWQSAINAGNKIVAESGKTYLVGTLTVNKDIEIDCNGAEFICSSSVLFDCEGTAATGTTEDNYTANGSYSLSDTFTGIAWLVGTNNVFKQRSYYYGGSVEMFYEGKLNTQIPVDITSVTAYRLTTIKADIKNIGNVSFSDTTNAVVIYQKYCAFSVIENINVTNLCYSVVQFWQCFQCSIRDSYFRIPQYGSEGNNYYPIGIYDTCYTSIINTAGYCQGWHCVSTGNHTLCRKTLVSGCQFYTYYGVPAYWDHENGIETIIENSTLSSVGVSLLSTVKNCDIVCIDGNLQCTVGLGYSSIEGLAVYSVEGCRFHPLSTLAGIRAYLSPQSAGYAYNYYFDSVSVTDCTNLNEDYPAIVVSAVSSNVTGITKFKKVYITNSPTISDSTGAEEVYIYPDDLLDTYITNTATGTVANFTDGAKAPVVSLISNIDYSADGYTGATIYKFGKNMYPVFSTETKSGVTVTNNGDGTIKLSGTATANVSFTIYQYLPAGTYTVSLNNDASSLTTRIRFYNSAGSSIGQMYWTAVNQQATLTFAEDVARFLIYITKSTAYSTAINASIQLEEGETATTFEAYNGSSVEIDWTDTAGTVYGGTLDLTNGILTSTYASDGTTLETPVQYTLSKTALMTLYGNNNIYSDTGDVTVEYRADTKLYITNALG